VRLAQECPALLSFSKFLAYDLTWMASGATMLGDDIAALRVEDDMERIRTIPRRGISAHLLLEYYRSLQKFGRTSRDAISEVEAAPPN
jgi:hypothetical protein